MQIEYGELLTTGNIRYATANNVGDMSNVIAVRAGLLISDTTQARKSLDASDYLLPGQTIVAATGAGAGAVTHPEDNRLRRTFETTVMLRNRD
jgi:type IV pilus assembly protein PilW